MDHYERLGVEANATRAEIRAAYRALARERHPDVSAAPGDMAALNEAWRVLRNTDLRSSYDADLASALRAPRHSPNAPATEHWRVDRSTAWAQRRPETEDPLGPIEISNEREARLHRLMVAFAIFCAVVAVAMMLIVMATPSPSGP